jgi:hypothetical protein
LGIGHTPSFPNPGDYLLYGVAFIPGTTAQLTTIQAPLFVASGPNQIQAFLMSDSGGSPGSILESFLLSNVPVPTPGPIPLVTITSLLDPLLLGGHQYWFVATGGPSTWAVWTLNLFQSDANDVQAEQSVVGGVTQPWIVSSYTRAGALQVSGTSVPEPSTAALFGCALLLLIICNYSVEQFVRVTEHDGPSALVREKVGALFIGPAKRRARILSYFATPGAALLRFPQDPLLWGSLEHGPYSIGFQSSIALDGSREYDGKSRPILLDVWCPAFEASAAAAVVWRGPVVCGIETLQEPRRKPLNPKQRPSRGFCR